MEVKQIKQLENNRTEIAITKSFGKNKKNAMTRYFQVENDKVDTFVSDFKKHQKKNAALGTAGLLASCMLGVALGNKVIKKFFIGGILGGLAFGLAGTALLAKKILKNDKEFLEKHNVKETFYLKEENTNLLDKATKK